MSSFKQPVSVLVVIHTPQLDILLIERAAHPGLWQSVTGSREAEEALIDTARREVAEETGIDCSVHALTDWQTCVDFEIFVQWRNRYAPGVTVNREHCFSLCVPPGQPIHLNPAEHQAYTWLPWQEAADKVFSWSNRDAILRLAQSNPVT